VDLVSNAFGEDELIERVKGYQALGIRSKTKVTERVIKSAPQVSRGGWLCGGCARTSALMGVYVCVWRVRRPV